jgi:hypothetical protein
VDHVELLVDLASVTGEISVDKVDDELGWVHVQWNRESAGIEVWLHFRDGSTVGGATLGEKQ